MSNTRLSMRKVREILRLTHEVKLPYREVATSAGVSSATSASAPLATSDRCDARSPNACRLSNTHCICRPGSPTNASSITGRSYQRFTVTIGFAPRRAAAAIVGASRPEQVHANAAASGIELSDDVLAAIDEALGDVPVKEPELAPLAQAGVKHRA